MEDKEEKHEGVNLLNKVEPIEENIKLPSPSNDFILNFSDNERVTTLVIKDVHKLGRLLYEMCIDNKIGVDITVTSK